MTIQSNTVLITGASRGLGANFSKVLAQDGFQIIGVGRNLQNLKSVISSLPNQDLDHSYLELDITDELQVQSMLNDLTVYALINNAGIANTKLLHEETHSDLTKIIDTNLLGSINVSNALIPNMIKNKNGKIINIASTLGYRPLSFVGAYSATKAALIQITKSQSIELAKYNICVNALAPGYILTDINKNETQSVIALYGQATGERITGVPTTFLIDRDGHIRQKYVGPRSEHVFYKDLKPYL